MTIFGTRPEAIKMAPVIMELQKQGFDEQIICVTGQHKEMLMQMLDLFFTKPNYDLSIMVTRQSLIEISTKVLLGLEEVLNKDRPDLVLVQGDTTTALMGALASYYQKIPVG